MMVYVSGAHSRWASCLTLSSSTLVFTTVPLLRLVCFETSAWNQLTDFEGWNDDYLDLIKDDPSRTLMGSRQENWFYNTLTESAERGAKWRLVGNQIIISRIEPIDEGINYLTTDNWSVSRIETLG